MKLKRVSELPRSEGSKIYARISVGTMKYYIDDFGYTLYDEDELQSYIPKKRGRPKKENVNGRKD